MATATKVYSKRRKPVAKKKKSGGSWLLWVPLLTGIVVAPLAIRAAGVLALSGPRALALLFPFVEIVRNPLLRLPGAAAQWVMYLQFPLYGLFMGVLLRSRNLLTALGFVIFLHGAEVLGAILLAHGQNPYLKF
jgi:hypothetical protein